MSGLGPDGDRVPVVVFLRDHYAGCLDELNTPGGCEQVRAGLVRLLGQIYAGDVRLRVLLEGVQAQAVLDPSRVEPRDAVWAGLCALEVAERLPGGLRDPIETAIRLAAQARRQRDPGEDSRADALAWMASRAEGCGWTDRARFLYDLALEIGFASRAVADRVRLSLARLLLEDGRGEEGACLLEEAARGDEPTVRFHARLALAALYESQAAMDCAHAQLEEALGEAYGMGEDGLGERVFAAMGELLDATATG
jgi:hypothetical protein